MRLKIEIIKTFMINHAKTILEGVIIAIVGAFLIAILSKIFSIIKKIIKAIARNRKIAIYLNSPKKCFDNNCIGRKNFLKKYLMRL